MCHRTVCSTCHKATWAGCGMHIQAAMQGVPMGERCAGWQTGRCNVCKPVVKTPKTNICEGEDDDNLIESEEQEAGAKPVRFVKK